MNRTFRSSLWSLLIILFALTSAAEEVEMFSTAEKCLPCHNRLSTAAGEDISIGTAWETSMMANSARDPYWQASVRREVLEHPEAKELIEDTCASCHMPMARYLAKRLGDKEGVFEHLPVGAGDSRESALAADGVSCNLCHQIGSDHFGEKESFNAGFVIPEEPVEGKRPSYGPYPPTEKANRVMEKITNFRPVEAAHIQKSELCATCHTLYTSTLGSNGEVIGELPEQMPYLEWKHSDFAEAKSCQSCHMPEVDEEVKIAIGGSPRSGFSRHRFRGGNAFMLSMLGRYADELGVQADPEDLQKAASVTVDHLASASARVEVENAVLENGKIEADLVIENLAGHKLPTAYPSRRVWLHVVVRHGSGKVLFESGKLNPDGSISGNDNDEDRTKYEPHYERLENPSQVQIYESILVDGKEEVTTALLRAIRYAKDNRILPRGFDKTTASQDIAVRGAASDDEDFIGASDTVRLEVSSEDSIGPHTIEVELLYQPIAFRWARNLELQEAPEIDRFVRMYDEMAGESAAVLARAREEL